VPISCSVTPAEAGVQRISDHVWIPAFAGMTGREQYFGHLILWLAGIEPLSNRTEP
jgi:hypothetical protein